MQIDVVYKLGPIFKAEWANYEELRYSLRSLSNFKNLGNVWIVGTLPTWIKNVRHIPMADPFNNPDANIINKLIRVCLHPELSENFIQMSDDQFLLKPCTLQDFIYPVQNNQIIDQEERLSGGKPSTTWQQRLERTGDLMRAQGYPGNYYEGHCPYLINKRMYPQILLDYPFEEIDLCGNTIYYNVLGAIGSASNVVRRVLPEEVTEGKLFSVEPHHLFFNYTARAFKENDTIKNALGIKYPDPSPFE